MVETSPIGADPGRRGRVIAVVVIALLMVILRVGAMSHAELGRGDEALAAGDEAEALRHYEAAAHAYLPGSPWVERSLTALWQLGEARLSRGDRQGALAAWSAIRGASLGARGLYTPNEAWLDRANQAIAELWLTEPGAAWPSPDASPEERRAEVWRALAPVAAPSPAWSLVVVLAFLGWVGGAVGFILRGFDVAGALRRPAALRWGGAVVALFTLWLIGMAQA